MKAPSNSLAWLGRICAIAIAVHLVLALGDLALTALEGTPESAGILAALGSNIVLYLAELILPLIAMIMLFTRAKSGDNKYSLIAAHFSYRRHFCPSPYAVIPCLQCTVVIPPVIQGTDFTTGPYPLSTGRYLDWDWSFATVSPYFPAGLEWLAALLPVGLAIVAIIVILWVMKKIQKPQS